MDDENEDENDEIENKKDEPEEQMKPHRCGYCHKVNMGQFGVQ